MIVSRLKQLLASALDFDVESFSLERTEPKFGDFASNIALVAAKPANKNPRELAADIATKIESSSLVNTIEIAGPGFINITLTDNALLALAQERPEQFLAGKHVVAEYSDPNPFKTLHAGHLYTTVIGDIITRLKQACGAKLTRLNFGGDVGRHVAITLWSISQEVDDIKQMKAIEPAERLAWLSKHYVNGTKAFESNEEVQMAVAAINAQVYEFHNANGTNSLLADIYWMGREWSYDGFVQLYEQLQVEPFDEFLPESQTAPKGVELVKKGLNKGVFEESDGAVIFNGEAIKLHNRVFLNSKGLPTYEAKDLGLAATKWERFQPDVNIIITGNDITEYMKVVLAAVEHFYPEIAHRTTHITHGNIKLAGAVKMSSRAGNVLTAKDVFTAAQTAAGKQSEWNTVLAAIKYSFAKQGIGSDVVFDPNSSVATEGNSGPYLQYAHARACSILAKSTTKHIKPESFDTNERLLVQEIAQFAPLITRAAKENAPQKLCSFAYELTKVFNRFYEQTPVIGSEREAQRLYIVHMYQQTLKDALQLIGISAPKTM